MTYVIKRADTSKEDTRRLILRLHKICFPGDKQPPLKDGHWWLIWHEGTAVAFAGIVPSAQWINCGYFSRAGVIPGHRGKHLQRRLIKVRVTKAKKLGWEAITTDTRDNPSSANNLIECGFRMYSPRKPWAYNDSCYWRIKL